ncbi:hypothetical protein RchiOBHm_Chr1g0332441 [Rosa chinensis]|uniref:Uncharacterized protein n=1 Tax=Rosa chinensis TaxID=74649 RepID=A0A2P6SBT8_ROSCH|nr:hypothetical protein RchiOBHm_Chr1g0332441 [Rosa chinensis]
MWVQKFSGENRREGIGDVLVTTNQCQTRLQTQPYRTDRLNRYTDFSVYRILWPVVV